MKKWITSLMFICTLAICQVYAKELFEGNIEIGPKPIPVPEPGMIAMLVGGILSAVGLFFFRKK